MRSEVKKHAASGAGFLTPCPGLRGRAEAVVGRFEAQDAPQLAIGSHFLQCLEIGVEAAVVIDGQDAAPRLREPKQFEAFRDRRDKWLVDHNVAVCQQASTGKRKVRWIRRCNYSQANGLDGQQFFDASDRPDIRKHLSRRITGALDNGRKPQSRHCANHWRMKASAGQSKSNQPDLDHLHDPQRNASSVPPARGGSIRLIPAASWFSPYLRYILCFVERTPAKQRGPARGLYLGLAVTILAVLAYGAYITMQFAGVRKLQSELVDHNRRDSLQLLRIQNDLNSIALAMRDMLDAGEPYPLIAWSAQLARIRADLDDAMLREEPLGEATRTTDQRRYLAQSLNQFWDANDRMFARAQSGDEQGAREQIRDTLQPRQAALISAVSRLLVQNTEGEEQAAARIAQIYDRVQRQLYFFLAAILLAIVVTSLYLIRNNRRLFQHVAELSSQRSELAQQLISTQESTLRHISRELHDEFGQILTAIGSLLRRAEKDVPANSGLRDDLEEVREIAQTTLNNTRSLSQALHPVLLEEAGLESTLDWYIPTVERQTGIVLHYEKSGEGYPIETGAGVQIYRVLQEALNNVSRHSNAKEAWIRLRFGPSQLELEVEDHGKGFAPTDGQPGIGLVAMRERAEILGGTLGVSSLGASSTNGAGTLVQLRIPRVKVEPHVE